MRSAAFASSKVHEAAMYEGDQKPSTVSWGNATPSLRLDTDLRLLTILAKVEEAR